MTFLEAIAVVIITVDLCCAGIVLFLGLDVLLSEKDRKNKRK